MIRRAVDVCVAGLALVLLAPVMIVVAGLVALDLGRPVLFRQQRSGLGGSTFSIVKFRTMRRPTHEGQSDQDRQTRLGERLRSLSLDELPQLWNIVSGDMSLIGPRPTLPAQVVHYSERQRGRLAVRPGLTGWAQVNGRNSLSWPERIELDLWYISHRSMALDVRILGRTAWSLVRPRGVVGEGGHNPDFPIPPSPPVEEFRSAS